MTDNAQAPVTKFHIFLDPRAGDDPAGDGGAAAAAAAAAAAEQETLLSQGTGAGGEFEIPEKFLVKNGEEVDHKATLSKMGQSYKELEKRIGTGDLPPKSADEYKVEKYLPDGFDENPAAMKPILGKMHELGMTNKQVQGVLNIFGETMGSGLAQEKASMEAGLAALKEFWGEKTQQNLAAANRAVELLADDEEKKALSDPKIANNPFLLRFLEKVNRELGEDRLPGDMGTVDSEELAALRKHPAYWDEKHPEHKAIVDKVSAMYQGVKQ